MLKNYIEKARMNRVTKRKRPCKLAMVRAAACSRNQHAFEHRRGVDQTVSEGIYEEQSGLDLACGLAVVMSWNSLRI